MIEIDGYSEVERIGRGGLGDVYRARRSSTGATVAIKVLRDVSDESVAWHRTRRELTALVALAGHANVVQLLEVLDLPEGPALVMEYAPGGSVAELMLRRDEPLSVGEAVLVGKQTAVALTAAHAQGIVHRDVKPQNLLIDAYGQVKLCDFGIAAVARSEEFQVRTSAISMRYASPEDLDDDVDVGPASDVYSLGATMLHMARGAPPTLRERLTPWIPPADAEPELAALDRIVARCLHPAPSERPTAADVADELERLAWSIDERNRSIGVGAGDGDVSPNDPPPSDVVPSDVERPSTPTAGATSAGGSEDDTVHRGDRAVRRDPADVRGPGRRRLAVIAVVAVVAVITVAALVGVVLRRDRSPDAVGLVERPGGLTDLERLEWPDGEPGECLVQADDRLEPVACAAPHDLQRIATVTLDELAELDDDVDVATVRAAARAACDAAVTSAIGRTVGELVLDAPFAAPSAATWRAGDRMVVCFVGAEGRRLVGDALDASG